MRRVTSRERPEIARNAASAMRRASESRSGLCAGRRCASLDRVLSVDCGLVRDLPRAVCSRAGLLR